MQVQPTCEKCGALAPIDPLRDNNEYHVWKVDEPCNCGGKFVVKEEGKKTKALPKKCATCEHCIKVDDIHVYIPCTTHCIKTGETIRN